jgi:hypothetical protein
MAAGDKQKTVTLEELMVSTLAMTDAVVKLLIEKGGLRTMSLKRSSVKNAVTTWWY